MNWLRRALPVLLTTPLALCLGASPAQATEPTFRGTQGYQAGQILNDDCTFTDSGNKLIEDKGMQARSGWLRIDFRHAADTSGCARGTFASLLNDTASPNYLDPDMSIIGLLTNEFHGGGPVEFAEAAKNIACDPTFSRVNVWEIGNEPDLNGVTPEAYAELLARTSSTIHSQCDKVVINGGLTAGDPFGYLNAVNAAMVAHPEWGYSRLKDAIQGLGLHPYVDAVHETATGTRHSFLAGFIEAFTETSGNGYSDMDIYLTEFGWRLPQNGTEVNEPDEVTNEEQCINIVRGFNTVDAERVVAATWFTLKDWPDDNRRFGLYEEGGAERDARDGYVWGHCNGVDGASYNADEEYLEWTGGITTFATVSYEVMLAPANAPNYTYFKTTSLNKLPMTAFNPPLPIGDYVWRVNKIVDGKKYPAKDEWQFYYRGYPTPPSDLAVIANANGTSVNLTWIDQSHSETGFEINDGVNSRNAAADTNGYTWTGLAPGNNYCFRMRAFNAYGPSRWSLQTVCVTTPSAPAAPSNVTATVVTGTSVRIDWTDNSNNENGFEVNDGTNTHSVGAGENTHTWTGIANGATKCFKVRSQNAVGWSAWAGNACATTPTIPLAPTGPTATVATGTSITVKWTDKSNNEWGFEIRNGAGQSQVVGANYTSYTWPGIPNGTKMCFQVRAYNLAGYSAYTTSVCATTPTIPIAPASPTATVVNGNSIMVKWADKSANEIGFEIHNGVTSKVAGANATSYTWGGLANGTYMCFRVRSYNLAGYSAYTGYACATTPTLPIAPASPVAIALNTSQIKISWLDKSNNETGFEVYNGVSIQSVSANLTNWTWGNLAPGTYMCFAVRAKNLAGYSAWTPYACATTPAPPIAPASPSAVPISASQIKVTWQDRSSNETGFQIYDGVDYHNVPANQTYFYRQPLPSKKYMCFAIRSYNAYGYSAFTPYACATTF